MYMFPESVFLVSRIILFFVATPFIYRAFQALDLSKLFKANSSDQIRFIYMVISIILGYLLIDALVSLFENMNQLL